MENPKARSSGRKRCRPLWSGLVSGTALAAVTVLQDLPGAKSDFVYPSFNSTHGITFVGSAATSSCVEVPALLYGGRQGQADQSSGTLPEQSSETLESVARTTYDTAPASEQNVTNRIMAGFGHRKNVEPALSTECPVRARLAPSLPNKAGAIWYSVPLPVLRGFETQFTFQITDHSRVCTEHSDPLFSAALHKTCSVRGGDGFAFVLHQDPQGLAAVGDNGAGMGYAGIQTSLAVEFDTWYNAQDGSTDLIYDHITVQGAGRFNKNTWQRAAALTVPKAHELADGQHHRVKIRYYPYVEMKYAQYFSATDQLKPFLMDNGENRRIGTLVVWVDDGIAAEVDTPLVAIPVNLSILLDVPAADPGGGVYVGFTAATGRAWAKHDIISWYWCHQNSCEEDRTDKWAQFDFHQTSKYFTTARFGEYTPDMRTS